ncbi:MAG TPA: 4a-hydroxytetrahydrobiopterin dehydratase [Rhodanobacter sp.]|jgi:4a-hydroxytetrahydrobiopterin dehydratase|nr:4a-hydroxytetrahydrobiopterin dehydratase [Rhodanobacter sp.]
MNQQDLAHEHCAPQKGRAPLDDTQIGKLLEQVSGWRYDDTAQTLSKDFRFKDFHHTLGFINAVGFIANQQDHHPDLEAGYGHCMLHWSTHDVHGLSRNDFICAARVDALMATA